MNLIDYINGDRKGKEANAIEKEAMSDAFLSDAIEGLDSVQGKHTEAIERLNRIITHHTQKKHTVKRRIMFLGYAASINAIMAFSTAAFVGLGIISGIIVMNKKSSGNFLSGIAISEKNQNYEPYENTPPYNSETTEDFGNINIIDEPKMEIKYVENNVETPEILPKLKTMDDIIKIREPEKAKRTESIIKPKVEPEIEEEIIPFFASEEKPKFMGSNANAFRKWILANISDSGSDCEGNVVVSFVVDELGNVKDVNIIKPFSAKFDSEFDSEIVKIISTSPKWTPAKQMGKAVPFEFTISVKLELHK